MTDIATTILELGLGLDLDERTVVAHKLLATLHDADSTNADVEAAWKAELRRRIDDIESGRVEPVSHAATVAMAREVARSAGEPGPGRASGSPGRLPRSRSALSPD